MRYVIRVIPKQAIHLSFSPASHPHPCPSSPHAPPSLFRCLFSHQREQQREQRLQQREGRQRGQQNSKALPSHSTAFSRVQPGEDGGDRDQRLPPPRTPTTPVDLRDTAGLPRLAGLAGLADLRLEQLGDQLGDVAPSSSADPLGMSSISPSDSTMRGGGGGVPPIPLARTLSKARSISTNLPSPNTMAR